MYFISGCSGPSLLHVAFSSCSEEGLLFAVVECGFSLWWLLSLGTTALEHRISSFGARA